MFIICLVLESPMLQLPKLIKKIAKATNTTVSTSTLCRSLARFGFTHKKIQRVALQRSLDFRASFVANTMYFKRQICMGRRNYKDMLRKYGCALRSERAVSQHLMVRDQRISLIAGICTDRILALTTTSNSVNG